MSPTEPKSARNRGLRGYASLVSRITRNYLETSYLRRVAKSIHDRGFWLTMRLIWDERWPDHRYRINIAGIVPLDNVEIPSGNRYHGVRYEAVNRSAFRAAMDEVRIPFEDFTFVDLGAGKGFAMILAAAYGFRKLIGVEFAPSLAAEARRNMERVKARDHSLPEWEIIQLDVTHLHLPAGNLLFFMCNPFDDVVLRNTFDNIVKQATPTRQVIVVYVNALHRHVLAELGFQLDYFSPNDPLLVYKGGIAMYRL